MIGKAAVRGSAAAFFDGARKQSPLKKLMPESSENRVAAGSVKIVKKDMRKNAF